MIKGRILALSDRLDGGRQDLKILLDGEECWVSLWESPLILDESKGKTFEFDAKEYEPGRWSVSKGGTIRNADRHAMNKQAELDKLAFELATKCPTLEDMGRVILRAGEIQREGHHVLIPEDYSETSEGKIQNLIEEIAQEHGIDPGIVAMAWTNKVESYIEKILKPRFERGEGDFSPADFEDDNAWIAEAEHQMLKLKTIKAKVLEEAIKIS